MQLDWARRRQIITLAIVIGSLLLIGTSIFFIVKSRPSCFDKVQNQDETGVDCGGICAAQCRDTHLGINTLWTKTFLVRKGMYDVASLVENPNLDASIPELSYTVELFDDEGRTLLSRTYSTFANAGDHFTLFGGGLDTQGVDAARARLTILPGYKFIKATPPTVRKVSVLGYELLTPDTAPRLIATLQNQTTDTLRHVPVTATVSDRNGPVGVSETYIDELAPRETKQVTFTWPQKFTYEAKGQACATPVDVILVLDRSGSMASDGKNPPQPLSMAKSAAEDFVAQLSAEDQAGYISFATEVTSPIDQPLTKDLLRVSGAIAGTDILTTGLQYTNIAAALNAARDEFSTQRKREMARQAVVMLTDGAPTDPKNPANPQDTEYPISLANDAAKDLKAKGVTLYTIGLGSDVNVDFLKGVASYPEYYYAAPSGSELGKVYKQIASTICKKGPSVVEIIPRIYELGETATH
ncbi:MAG TPA: vWA domain-containing protein [Candidatus Paceibacterota bacterium]|nr:vWA domain-containing protein [Candidatus Paceibacterota bacterium]